MFALVYGIVSAVVVRIGFKIFKTRFDLPDIALMAVGAALASLIPRLGGIASLAAMIGILYWRLGKDQLFPDIVASVVVARLAMLPVLLLMRSH